MIFSLVLVLVILELLWIGFTVSQQFSTPTLQLQARLSLLKYIVTPQEARKLYLMEAAEQRIVIWPENGIEVDQEASLFLDNVRSVIQNSFMEEYDSLSMDARTGLNFTFIDVRQDLISRIQRDILLDVEEISELIEKDEGLLFSYISDYVGFNRYQWHGFEKSLFYVATLGKQKGKFLIFFASVSDIADKSQFIEALAGPVGLFLFTLFAIMVYSLFVYQRENKILLIQKRIREASSFPQLIETLFEVLSSYIFVHCYSCSLQIIHEESFSLFTIGKDMAHLNYDHIIEIDPLSVTAQRIKKIKIDAIDIFEFKTEKTSKKGAYAMSLPIMKDGKVLAFINLNFLNPPFGKDLCFLMNKLLQSINESFGKILTVIVEKQELELEHYRQWVEDRRDQNLDILFDELTEHLISDSKTKTDFLPPIKMINGFRWMNGGATALFPGSKRHTFDSHPKLVDAIEKMEKTVLPRLLPIESTMQLLIPLNIPFQQSYVQLIFEAHLVRLTQLMVEHFQNVFSEFVKHVAYYSEKVCRDYAYEELVRLATGLQPEVQEILKQKVEIFFGIPGNSFLSHQEIVNRMGIWMRYESEFEAQGYGMLVEMDLRNSTLLKKNFNKPELQQLYDQAIYQMNEACLQSFSKNGSKFVTPNPSGGDGDGLRFFVTSCNRRQTGEHVIEIGEKITEQEKTHYNRYLIQSLLEVLCCSYRAGVPFKLGGLLLDHLGLMSLSLERGSIKINSYLNGFVERARFEKGVRIESDGKPEFQIDIKYFGAEWELVEFPKRIYQPWCIVVPATLFAVVQEEAPRWGCSFRKILVPDYVSNTSDTLKTYLEIYLNWDHSFHSLFPFLCRLPLGCSIEKAQLMVQTLQRFYAQEKNSFSASETKQFFKSFCEDNENLFTMEDLQHLLDPVNEVIHGPGLYMILQKGSIFLVPFTELKKQLNFVENHLLYQLQIAHKYSFQFFELEKEYEKGSAIQKTQILKELNGLFREYCKKMKLEKYTPSH
ncbi:MAG: hypothetical protein HQM14_08055 [SAR324 cluster bacterium]|nr:hypothetical protein [SAR324 cluster bacterium]